MPFLLNKGYDKKGREEYAVIYVSCQAQSLRQHYLHQVHGV